MSNAKTTAFAVLRRAVSAFHINAQMTQMLEQALPATLIVVATLGFLMLERTRPGRPLPQVRGWVARAVLMNLLQLLLIGAGGLWWNRYFREHALMQLGHWQNPVVEGAFYWFVGTFVFYWWHRLRHAKGFWLALHQIHHSPSRIEVLTSFYKHPLEIAADSILTGFLIYCVFGGSALAGAWTSFFGAVGEYFYHSNIRTPIWIGWFIQRPEHHSIHHQLDVHKYNFGDLTIWDRLFGTFKETDGFAERCGFPGLNEARLTEMLRFKDVYMNSELERWPKETAERQTPVRPRSARDTGQAPAPPEPRQAPKRATR